MQVTDFRHFIVEELQRLQKEKPGYPVGRFAADLGLSSQLLNQILKKKSGLSPKTALDVAKRLRLKGKDKDIFLTLVESKHHRSKFVRDAAKERLKELQAEKDFDELSTEEFSVVSRWYYMACAMLVDVVDFKQDYGWIASRLGIDPEMARDTYEKLFEKGLLREEDGKWVRDAAKFMIRAKSVDSGLRAYHRDLLQIAEKQLEQVDASERHVSASMISISESELDLVRESIDTFRRRVINEVTERGGDSERVYCLSVQLFPIDQRKRVRDV